MLRVVFTIGLLALLGLVAIKLIFGLVSVTLSVALLLLKIAVPVLLFAGVGYLALKIVAPDTAKRIRDGASGSF